MGLYLGIMEKRMETTTMGLYRDNGKENGNYYNGFRGLFVRLLGALHGGLSGNEAGNLGFVSWMEGPG